MKKKRLFLLWLILSCMAVVIFCGWNFYQEIILSVKAEQVYNQIRESTFQKSAAVTEENKDIMNMNVYSRKGPDFDTLLQWNPDITGWIWSPGSDIDYPIVQGSDNNYYLNHMANGERSIIGSIFMESLNQKEFKDDVTILYGHHIRGGQIFSSLSGYKTQSYYEEHPILYLYTPDQNYRVDLFAGEILDGQKGSFPIIFKNTKARKRWLKKLLISSTFKSPVVVEEHDRILVLCTCSYEYNNARYAVYGVLSDLEEEQDEK